jgi:hypothetical protein
MWRRDASTDQRQCHTGPADPAKAYAPIWGTDPRNKTAPGLKER